MKGVMKKKEKTTRTRQTLLRNNHAEGLREPSVTCRIPALCTWAKATRAERETRPESRFSTTISQMKSKTRMLDATPSLFHLNIRRRACQFRI